MVFRVIKKILKRFNYYIDTYQPFDKAGAYGIQGIGAKFIVKIDGDYYSVMGMPVHKLYNKIKQL